MKKGYLKRIISALLCLTLFPACYTAYAEEKLYVNKSFDSYLTNETPSDLDIRGRAAYIDEYAEGDKGLLLYADMGSSSISFTIPATEKLVISFDIKTIGNAPKGAVSVINSAGISQDVMRFFATHDVSAGDGFKVGSYGASRIASYAVAYDGRSKTCNIYENGKLQVDDYILTKSAVSTVSTVKFEFSSDDGTDGVIIDNINIHSGSAPLASYPKEVYNEESYEAPEVQFGKRVGDTVQINTDFESGVQWAQTNALGNRLEIITEEDGNKAFLIEKNANVGCFVDAGPVNIDTSDTIVYEFRLKVQDKDSFMVLQQKDTAAHFYSAANLNDLEWTFVGGYTKKLKLDTWYNIGFIEDYYNRKIYCYLDKTLVSEADLDASFVTGGADPGVLRFFVTIYTGLSSAPRPLETDTSKFLIDDIRIYDGEELKDELGAITHEIDLTTTKSIFTSDSAQAKTLENYQAVHTRSGVVLTGGEKSLLKNRPFTEEGVAYLPAEELCEKLGAQYQSAGGGRIVDGVEYQPADSLLASIGKSGVHVDSEYNSGLIVLNTGFKAPADKDELQRLNDYMFYLRPDAEDVKAAYEASPNYGVHPRIFANKEDFDRIRAEIETNEYKRGWKATVIENAEQVMEKPVTEYTLMNTGSTLNTVARPVMSRMYSLAMAYQLTGDKKYAERAYREIEAVASYNWIPVNDHLVAPEMGGGIAIAYDWMYDAFTEEQRKFIEETLYNNLFWLAYNGYLSAQSAMQNGAIASNNHNIVVNGGIMVGALALMDVYPEVSAWLAKNAIRGADIMMWHFAPNGAWYEGPHYWEYTAQYTAKMFASMQTALGTDFGFMSCEGLDVTADFILNMQSAIGIYNYGDGILVRQYPPEIFWLSDEYNNEDFSKVVLNNTLGKYSDAEDAALALIWYDVNIPQNSVELPKDKYYPDQGTIVMRSSWDESEPTFVGIHAGETNIDHAQLDGGSFIFENQGIRWAKDLGMGNYNAAGYWEDAPGGRRWTHFRSRAESHNTIVINPDAGEDHMVDSYADMQVVEDKERGAIVTVDMSQLLSKNASKAKRGFFFTDNRESLVIRDEISLKKASDVYWILMTAATAEQTGDGHIVLTQDGRKLRLDYTVSGGTAEFSCERAKPFPTSPVTAPGDDPEETDNRLLLHITGSGDVTITVKLSAYNAESSDVSEYDTDITNWHVPDGALPVKPALDSVYIDGERYETNGKTSVDYVYCEGDLTAPPEITAYSDNYNISVEQAAKLNDGAKIIVTDTNDPSNKAVYMVYFSAVPRPREFEGRESIPILAYSVSDEQTGLGDAIHLFDNSLETRWAAEGVGQWAIFDLKTVQHIDDIAMAGYNGEKGRKYYFTISTSTDGVNYTQVYSGESSGTTNDFEFYPTGGVEARYVKMVFNGNSEGGGENWNSILGVIVTRNK